MICSKCGKDNKTGRFCEKCGSPLTPPSSGNGMATLRVVARKTPPTWMIVIQPWNYFRSYKVYVSVDGQEYKLKSKKQVLDIPVAPGTHFVRLSSTSITQSKVLKGIGYAVQFGGAVNGSAGAYVLGNVMEDVGGVLLKDGAYVEFEPGEFMEMRVRMDFKGQIVEDKG